MILVFHSTRHRPRPLPSPPDRGLAVPVGAATSSIACSATIGRTVWETVEWHAISRRGRSARQPVSTRHAGAVILRPTLRPGAPLLRRDATHLQVGTSPGTVIDDRPGLGAFLRLLNGVRDVEQLRRLARSDVPELEADVDDVLKPLLVCGAVVDARSLHVRRPRLRVALHDDAGSLPLARAVGHVLADLGIRTLDPPEPDLLLVVSCGEPARAVFDEAQRHGISHLSVVLDEDRVAWGPW